MNAMIEGSQQYFSFFAILWPIWLVFLLIGIAGKCYKSEFLVRLSNILFIGVGASLILTRLLVFTAFPYGDIAEEYAFPLPENSSKIVLIDHNQGLLSVNYEERDSFRYEGKDLKGIKRFQENNVVYKEKEGNNTTYEAIHFDSFSTIPIIGRVDSQTKLTIPASVTQDLYITFQETDATIDLSSCKAKKIQILSAYSKFKLVLPTTAINQEITLVTRVSEVAISYTKGANVRLLESSRTVNKGWNDFDNVDGKYYEYLQKGGGKDLPVITVELTYAKPELVLNQISGHND